jgi:hypothetical protein
MFGEVSTTSTAATGSLLRMLGGAGPRPSAKPPATNQPSQQTEPKPAGKHLGVHPRSGKRRRSQRHQEHSQREQQRVLDIPPPLRALGGLLHKPQRRKDDRHRLPTPQQVQQHRNGGQHHAGQQTGMQKRHT